MSGESILEVVGRLRREFDEPFTRAHASHEAPISYVLVRVGEVVHAVATTGLERIGRCPPITRLPTHAPALLGLAAAQGAIVGLYALSDLLGLAPGTGPRGGWMLVCLDGETGLVVDGIAGCVRVGSDAVRRASSTRADASISAVLDVEGDTYPVIDVSAVMQRLGADTPSSTSRDEDQWRG